IQYLLHFPTLRSSDLNLHLNVLQDYIDINGGTFRLKVKWYKGNIYIDQEENKGGVVHFKQMPLSATADSEMKDEILDKMPGVSRSEEHTSELQSRFDL